MASIIFGFLTWIVAGLMFRAGVIVTDIQLGIVVTLVVGGLLMMMVGTVEMQLRKRLRHLDQKLEDLNHRLKGRGR